MSRLHLRSVRRLCVCLVGSSVITFDPPLPARKVEAISRLGFGCLNKLVMEFESAFWLDEDSFGCVRDRPAVRGRLYMYWNIHRVTGRPILVSLLSGDSAYESEQAGTEQLVAECMELLRRMFGPQVPDPLRSLSTRWAADPFARGSYSYVAVGATEEDYISLAQPVNKTLFFAGEVSDDSAWLKAAAPSTATATTHAVLSSACLCLCCCCGVGWIACRLPTGTTQRLCMVRTLAVCGRRATCYRCGVSHSPTILTAAHQASVPSLTHIAADRSACLSGCLLFVAVRPQPALAPSAGLVSDAEYERQGSSADSLSSRTRSAKHAHSPTHRPPVRSQRLQAKAEQYGEDVGTT